MASRSVAVSVSTVLTSTRYCSANLRTTLVCSVDRVDAQLNCCGSNRLLIDFVESIPSIKLCEIIEDKPHDLRNSSNAFVGTSRLTTLLPRSCFQVPSKP